MYIKKLTRNESDLNIKPKTKTSTVKKEKNLSDLELGKYFLAKILMKSMIHKQMDTLGFLKIKKNRIERKPL